MPHTAIALQSSIPGFWSGVTAGDLLSAGLNAISILAAILVAGWLTPRLASRTARRDQQERLLRVLLNTWLTPANPEYQSAIALLPLDFKECREVLDLRIAYLKLVNTKVDPNAEAEHFQKQRQAQAEMMAAMAHNLDFDISTESLLSGGYISKGYVDREALLINAMIAWQRIATALELSNKLAFGHPPSELTGSLDRPNDNSSDDASKA